MEVIKVKNLTVTYNRKPAIKGVNLTINNGKIIGIIGPNGAGKSTLIKGILGFLPIDTGEVKILGKNVSEVLKKISYIPQKEQFDWDFPISVYDVVVMGRYPYLSLFGHPSQNDKSIVLNSLEKVEMIKYKDTQIRNLSGRYSDQKFIRRTATENFSGKSIGTAK